MKIKYQKHFIGYFLIILILLLIIIFAVKEPDIDLSYQKKKDKPDFSFDKVKISQLSDGKTDWILYADYAEIDKIKKTTKLKTVNGYFYSKNKKNLKISAPFATLRNNQEIIYMGNTKAKILGKKVPINMLCKTLIWDSKNKTLIGKEDIEIYTADIKLKGKYLHSDMTMRKMVVYDDAYLEIHEKKN